MNSSRYKDRLGIISFGDFNSHSTLWGGRKTDTHGEITLDLTLVSSEVAWTCEWEVWEDSTIGSDHHPIFSNIHIGWEVEEREVQSVR